VSTANLHYYYCGLNHHDLYHRRLPAIPRHTQTESCLRPRCSVPHIHTLTQQATCVSGQTLFPSDEHLLGPHYMRTHGVQAQDHVSLEFPSHSQPQLVKSSRIKLVCHSDGRTGAGGTVGPSAGDESKSPPPQPGPLVYHRRLPETQSHRPHFTPKSIIGRRRMATAPQFWSHLNFAKNVKDLLINLTRLPKSQHTTAFFLCSEHRPDLSSSLRPQHLLFDQNRTTGSGKTSNIFRHLTF
jgi:hypothetical protein